MIPVSVRTAAQEHLDLARGLKWPTPRSRSREILTRSTVAILCLLLLLATGCSSTWSMYRQGASRSGRSEVDTSGNNGNLQWSFSSQTGGWFNGPVIGNAKIVSKRRISFRPEIFVGEVPGNLYSFNPDGSIAWGIYVGAEYQPIPCAVGADGTVYVEGSGSLVAISPTGTVNWTFQAPNGSQIVAYPAIASDGTIYTGDTSGVFYALNPDGSLKWQFADFQFDCGGGPQFCLGTLPPAIGTDGSIYAAVVTDWDVGTLFALTKTGTLLWSSNYIGYPAVAPSGSIYVTDRDFSGQIYALSPSGNLLWQVCCSITLPAIALDGTIYVGSSNTGSLGSGGLSAINPDGTLKWNTSPNGENWFQHPPTLGGDGTIYIPGDTLLAINPDGSLKWSAAYSGGGNGAEPVIGADGTIYTAGQTLQAFH